MILFNIQRMYVFLILDSYSLLGLVTVLKKPTSTVLEA